MKVVGVSAAAKRRSGSKRRGRFVAGAVSKQAESSAEPDREQTLSAFTIGVFGLSGVIFIRCFLLPKLDVGGSNPLARC